jgi:hypothetical protein
MEVIVRRKFMNPLLARQLLQHRKHFSGGGVRPTLNWYITLHPDREDSRDTGIAVYYKDFSTKDVYFSWQEVIYFAGRTTLKEGFINLIRRGCWEN